MSLTKQEWTPTMTDEEMVLFDLKGYILFPAVLSPDEIAPIKEQCEKYRQDRQSLPLEAQCLPGGPVSALIDHPAIMRVLHSVIDDETEKIRLEGASLSYRCQGEQHRGWNPHAGGKTVNPNYSSMSRRAYLLGYDPRRLGAERRRQGQRGDRLYPGQPQI
jgi:hypothetical protein